MRIRKATLADARDIKSAHYHAYQVNYRGYAPDDYLNSLVLDDAAIQRMADHIKENEYYVLATKENKNNQTNYMQLYKNYINQYNSLEDSFAFYYVDLSDALNKKYIGDNLNISDEINEIRLNDDVLFKIKNNKIEKYYTGSSNILDVLSKLK